MSEYTQQPASKWISFTNITIGGTGKPVGRWEGGIAIDSMHWFTELLSFSKVVFVCSGVCW